MDPSKNYMYCAILTVGGQKYGTFIPAWDEEWAKKQFLEKIPRLSWSKELTHPVTARDDIQIIPVPGVQF